MTDIVGHKFKCENTTCDQWFTAEHGTQRYCKDECQHEMRRRKNRAAAREKYSRDADYRVVQRARTARIAENKLRLIKDIGRVQNDIRVLADPSRMGEMALGDLLARLEDAKRLAIAASEH